jgi:hypothetical protein
MKISTLNNKVNDMTNKRGNKCITENIKSNFENTLDELFKFEPVPKQKKDSAKSLMIQHRSKIQLLLDTGYSAEQIAIQFSKIGLRLSPETIRIVMRNTDDYGNTITKDKKSSNGTRQRSKPIAKAPVDGAPPGVQPGIQSLPSTPLPALEKTQQDVPVAAPISVILTNKLNIKRPPLKTKESY